jgi:hypothetical protein
MALLMPARAVLRCAMSDRISRNICRGTATSAVWYVTPHPQAVSAIRSNPSASTYPAFGHRLGQDGDPRVPVLISDTASLRPFRIQVSETLIEQLGHLASTTHRPQDPPALRSADGRSLDYAAFTALTSNFPPRRSTARAIRAN